jgi:hypothetical protein
MELINGDEVRVKETVIHGDEFKTFSLCALVSVDMSYTKFKISKSWEEVFRSVDNVVPTNWASCNTAKTLREASGSPN